jgi:hypothetical protein
MAQTTSVDRLVLDATQLAVLPLGLASLNRTSPTNIGLATEFTPTPYLWVTLRDLLSDCSYDEALLLCEVAVESSKDFDQTSVPQEWVAWVPDVGEVRLQRHQFYGRS